MRKQNTIVLRDPVGINRLPESFPKIPEDVLKRFPSLRDWDPSKWWDEARLSITRAFEELDRNASIPVPVATIDPAAPAPSATWTPSFKLVSVGDGRSVLYVTWSGGSGTASPASGYVTLNGVTPEPPPVDPVVIPPAAAVGPVAPETPLGEILSYAYFYA